MCCSTCKAYVGCTRDETMHPDRGVRPPKQGCCSLCQHFVTSAHKDKDGFYLDKKTGQKVNYSYEGVPGPTCVFNKR